MNLLRNTNRTVAVLCSAVYFLVLLAEGVHCFMSAHASLDSLVYVSLAESPTQNLLPHAATECLAELPADTSGCAALVTSGQIFHEAEAYSPADWLTFARLYKVKPLFVLTAQQLHTRTHISGLRALRWVCALSFVGVGIVVWLWLQAWLGAAASSLFALLIMTFSQVVRMGQSLTPDAFACFFLLLGIYLVLHKRWLIASSFVLILAVLARPETILFAVLFGLLFLYRAAGLTRPFLLRAAALLVVAAALQLGVGHVTHPVAWPVFFKTSFVHNLQPALFATEHLSLRDYLHAELTVGANSAAQYLPLEILLGLIALAGGSCPRAIRDLLYVCAAATVIRFALYPTMDERFYTPFLLITMVAAVSSVCAGEPGMKPFGRQQRPSRA